MATDNYNNSNRIYWGSGAFSPYSKSEFTYDTNHGTTKSYERNIVDGLRNANYNYRGAHVHRNHSSHISPYRTEKKYVRAHEDIEYPTNSRDYSTRHYLSKYDNSWHRYGWNDTLPKYISPTIQPDINSTRNTSNIKFKSLANTGVKSSGVKVDFLGAEVRDYYNTKEDKYDHIDVLGVNKCRTNYRPERYEKSWCNKTNHYDTNYNNYTRYNTSRY